MFSSFSPKAYQMHLLTFSVSSKCNLNTFSLYKLFKNQSKSHQTKTSMKSTILHHDDLTGANSHTSSFISNGIQTTGPLQLATHHRDVINALCCKTTIGLTQLSSDDKWKLKKLLLLAPSANHDCNTITTTP